MNDQIQRLTSAAGEIASVVETMGNNPAPSRQAGRDDGALQPVIGARGLGNAASQGGDEHVA
eukprot:5727043-Pyramimonas_sp.AAC.1